MQECAVLSGCWWTRYERGADSWTDEALLNGLDVSTDPVRDFRKETYAFFEKSSDQTSERWENEQERVG